MDTEGRWETRLTFQREHRDQLVRHRFLLWRWKTTVRFYTESQEAFLSRAIRQANWCYVRLGQRPLRLREVRPAGFDAIESVWWERGTSISDRTTAN